MTVTSISLNTCAICLDPLQAEEPIVKKVKQLACNHLFHEVCVEPWLKFHRNSCPLCRLEQQQDALTINDFFFAVRGGYIQPVRAYNNLLNPYNRNYAISLAAANGHTEIVQFLCERMTQFFSPHLSDAFQNAAKNGHEETVQYLLAWNPLFFERDRGIAVYLAAGYGHENIVRSLCEGRPKISEYYRTGAIRFAEINAHLEIVRYLKSLDTDCHCTIL